MLRYLTIILLALLVGYCLGLFGWAFLSMYGLKALVGTLIVLLASGVLLTQLTELLA